MNSQEYYVYKHTLSKDFSKKQNDMIYIGITSQKPIEKRWLNGRGYLKNTHFDRAIRKYGWNNFKHEILFSGLTKEEAEKKEMELIAFYDSTNSLKGYNKDNGGNTIGTVTEEAKKKISIANGKKVICLETGEVYYSTKDAAKKLKISERGVGHSCDFEINGSGGFHFLYEEDATKEKILEVLNKPLINPTRAVFCIETEEIFDTILQAAQDKKCSAPNITKVCKRQRNLAGGFHWCYLEDVNKENIEKIKKVHSKKFRSVVCLETNEKYNTITQASKEKNISPGAIVECCQGKRKLAGKLHWEYLLG